MLANARQLKAHDGPWFQHWRRRVIAAFGAVLLEDWPVYTEEEVPRADDR